MSLRPFHLHQYISKPDLRPDPAPWILLGALLCFWAMLLSRYLEAPGVPLELPTLAPQELAYAPVSAVLTAKAIGGREEKLILLFEGRIISLERLESVLRQFYQDNNEAHPVLLLKADRNVKIEQIFTLYECARRAGFRRLHLAGDLPRQTTDHANWP